MEVFFVNIDHVMTVTFMLRLFILISSSVLLRWLVYAHPFFQGVPRVLEVGGYSNPEAWGVEKPYVGSVHPLKIVSGSVGRIYTLCSLLILYKSVSPDCLQ